MHTCMHTKVVLMFMRARARRWDSVPRRSALEPADWTARECHACHMVPRQHSRPPDGGRARRGHRTARQPPGDRLPRDTGARRRRRGGSCERERREPDVPGEGACHLSSGRSSGVRELGHSAARRRCAPLPRVAHRLEGVACRHPSACRRPRQSERVGRDEVCLGSGGPRGSVGLQSHRHLPSQGRPAACAPWLGREGLSAGCMHNPWVCADTLVRALCVSYRCASSATA